MNLSKVVSSFVVAAVLSGLAIGAGGCGKSLPKLTDDQKIVLSDTLHAAGRGANAVRHVGSGLPKGPPVTPNRDEVEISMEAALRSARDNQLCLVTSSFPDLSSGTVELKDLNLNLKMTGATCPINLSFEVDVHGSDSSVDGRISGRYIVRNSEFAKLNDVTSFSMEGTFSGHGNQDNAKGELDLAGSLTSQKHGKVNFRVDAEGSGSGKTGEGEVVVNFVFSEFEAEFKVKVKNDETTYELNGEQVSQREFERYFDSLLP